MDLHIKSGIAGLKKRSDPSCMVILCMQTSSMWASIIVTALLLLGESDPTLPPRLLTPFHGTHVSPSVSDLTGNFAFWEFISIKVIHIYILATCFQTSSSFLWKSREVFSPHAAYIWFPGCTYKCANILYIWSQYAANMMVQIRSYFCGALMK